MSPIALLLGDVAVFEGLLFPLVNLAVLATWAYVLVDLFRNPRLSGGAKAMWLLAIVLLPIAGAVIYLGVREDW
jgi:Phospholipase_D-nuclease N-terminal